MPSLPPNFLMLSSHPVYQSSNQDQVIERLEEHPQELQQLIEAISEDKEWLNGDQNKDLERAIIQISLINNKTENKTILKIFEIAEASEAFKNILTKELANSPILIHRCLKILNRNHEWSANHRATIKSLINTIIEVNLHCDSKFHRRNLSRFRQQVPQLALYADGEDLRAFKRVLNKRESELAILMIEQGILDTEQARSDPNLLTEALWASLEVVKVFFDHGIKLKNDGSAELNKAISNYGIKNDLESEQIATFLAANGAVLKEERYSYFSSYSSNMGDESALKHKLRPIITTYQKNSSLKEGEPLYIPEKKEAFFQWLFSYHEIEHWLNEHEYVIPELLKIISQNRSHLDEIPQFLQKAHLNSEKLELLVQLAIENGNDSLLAILQQRQLIPNRLNSLQTSPLQYALEKGAYASALTLFQSQSLIKKLLPEEQQKAWIALCRSPDPLAETLLCKLLEADLSFDQIVEESTGDSALILALKNNKLNATYQLLEKIAHTPLLNRANKLGERPLSIALKKDLSNLIPLLLDDGADPALLKEHEQDSLKKLNLISSKDKNPQEVVKELSTTKNLANFIADGFMRGMKDEKGHNLEGNSVIESTLYLKSLTDALLEEMEQHPKTKEAILGEEQNDKEKALIKFSEQLDQSSKLSNEYDKIRSSPSDMQQHLVDALSSRISHSIRILKPGESIVIPSGWSNEKDGHAMLCVIRCTSKGTYECLTINTGDGILYHAFLPGPAKRYVNPVCAYQGLSMAEVSDSKFIQALIEPRAISIKPNYKYGAADIYEGIFNRFKDKLVPVPELYPYITEQRAGSCSIRSWLAYMHICLGHDSYKTSVHVLRRIALAGALSKSGSSLADEPKRAEILRKGTENFCRNTLTLAKSSSTKEPSDQASETLSLQDFLQIAAEEQIDLESLPDPIPEQMLQTLIRRLLPLTASGKGPQLTPEQVVRSLLLAFEVFHSIKQIPVIDSTTHTDFISQAEAPLNSAVLSETLQTIDAPARKVDNLSLSKKPAEEIASLEHTLQNIINPSPEQLVLQLEEAEAYCMQAKTDAEQLAAIDYFAQFARRLPLPLLPEDQWKNMDLEKATTALNALHNLSRMFLYHMRKNAVAFPDRVLALYKVQAIAFELACHIEELQYPDKKNKLRNFVLPFAPLRDLKNHPHNPLYSPSSQEELNELINYYTHRHAASDLSSKTLFDYSKWDNKSWTIELPFPQTVGDYYYLSEWMERVSDWSSIDKFHFENDEAAKIYQSDWRFANFWIGKEPSLPKHFAVLRDLSLFNTLFVTTSSYIWKEDFSLFKEEKNLFYLKRATKWGPSSVKLAFEEGINCTHPYIQKEISNKTSNSYPLTHFYLQDKQEKALESSEKQNSYTVASSKEVEPFFSMTAKTNLTPYHVLNWIKRNPHALNNKQNQAFVNLALFRENQFVKELRSNPSLGTLYLETIDSSLAESDLMIKESLKSVSEGTRPEEATQELLIKQLFLYQLRLKILDLIREASVTSTSTINVQQEAIKTRLRLEKMETLNDRSLQRAIGLTYVASFSTFPPIASHEAKKILEHLWFAQFYSEETKKSDPTIEHEAKQLLIKETAQFNSSEIFQNALIPAIKQISQQLYGISLSEDATWSLQFPKVICSDKGHTYEADLFSRELKYDNMLLDSLKILYQNPRYQHAFGEQKFSISIVKPLPTGEQMTEVFDEQGNSIRFYPPLNSKSGIHIERDISGTTYCYVPWDQMPSYPQFPILPKQPNPDHYVIWRSSQDGSLRIVDRETQQPFCQISHAGEFIFPQGDSYDWVDIANMPEAQAAIQLDQPKNILALQASDKNWMEIQYCRYRDSSGNPIIFTKQTAHEESNEAPKFTWNHDPQYAIAKSQKLTGIPHFHQFLILENSKGEQKALIPLKTYSTLQNPDFKPPPDEFECQAIPLDKNQRLNPQTTKQLAFAAYLALMHQNYHLASEYLDRAYSLKRYSAEDLKYLGWIIHSIEESNDHDPNAYAIRSYAAWLADYNLFQNPSDQRRSETEKEATITSLYQSAHDWDNYFSQHGQINLETTATQNASFTEYIANHYSKYLTLRKNVDIQLRLDTSSKRISKIRAHEEMLWIQQLLKRGGHNQYQLIERLSKLTQFEQPEHQPYPSTHYAEPSEANLRDFNILAAKATLDESAALIDQIFPRTRPGTRFQEYFHDFYLVAISGTPEQQKKLLHLLYDMRYEKDPLNQALRVILEALILKDPVSKEILKQFQEVFKNSKHNQTRFYLTTSNIQTLNESIKSYLSRNSFKLEGDSYQAKAMAKAIKMAYSPLPLSIPPDSEAPLKNRLKLEVMQSKRAPYLQKDRIGKESYVKLQTEKAHAPFPEANPASVYAEKRYERLSEDYQEGCKKNDQRVTYHFNKQTDFKRWKKQLEHNQTQEQAENAALLVEILSLAQKSAPMEAMSLEDAKSHLKKHGKKQAEVTLPSLLAAFAQESKEEYKRLNPLLTDEEIASLHNQIGTYIALSLDDQRNQRKIALLTQIETEADLHLREEALQALGERSDYEDLPEIFQSPPLLLFQYLMEMGIRKDQVEDIKTLLGLSSLSARGQLNEIPNRFKQKIMGGGKTLVLGTLLALLKADGYHLSILIPPSSLFDTNVADAQLRSEKLFGQKTHTILFKRDSTHFNAPYLTSCYETLVNAIKHRESIILPPESLQALENKYWEVRKELHDLYLMKSEYESQSSLTIDAELKAIENRIAALKQPNRILKEILKLINQRAIFTFDEVDSILETLKEMNFPVGDPQPVSKSSQELITELYKIAATDPAIIACGLDLIHNQPLSREKFKEVQPLLTRKIVEKLTQSEKWRERLFLNNLSQEQEKARIEEIFHYLSSLDRSTPNFVRALHQSNDPEQFEAAELLTLCRQELNEWLVESWKRSAGVHYGFSRLYPNKHFAIPFSANNKPNEKSEYADAYKSINTTLQLYLSAGLKEEQTAQLVETLQRKVKREWAQEGYPPDITKMPTFELFYRVTKLDLLAINRKQTQTLQEVQIRLRKGGEEGVQLMFDYLVEHVLPQITVYPEQISHNAQTLASMPHVKQGYSGSMENSDTFPEDVEVLLDHGTGGQIIDVLFRENDTVHILEKGSITDHLKQVLGWPALTHPHAKQFYGMVDLGPIYKGEKSEEQARAILKFMQEHPNQEMHKIQGVLYWDDLSNMLCCIKWKEKEPIPLRATDRESIAAITGLKADERFVFFPHHKLTGADIALPADAYLLTTFSEDTPLRDLEQGVTRARGIFKQQHIETLILRPTLETISSEIAKPSAFDSPTIQDLFIYSEKMESARQEALLAYSYIQKISNHAREYVKQSAYHAENEREEDAMFAQGQHLILRKQGGSLFQQYGGKHGEVSTEAYFTQRADQALLPLGKFSLREIVTTEGEVTQNAAKLSPELQKAYLNIHQTIQKALNKLPATLLNPESFDWGRVATVEVQMQTESYSEHQMESEYLVDLETFQQNKLDFIPHTETAWSQGHIKEVAEKGITTSPYPTSNASHPPVWSLSNVLTNLPHFKSYAKCFPKHLLVSENFVKTVENQVNLFDKNQKSIYNILAIQDSSEESGWKLCILSIEEAAFFKQQLDDHAGSLQNMWLMDSEGIPISKGSQPFAQLSHQDQTLFQQAFILVLYLCGNVKALNHPKWFEAFKKWSSDHKKEKRELLETIILEEESLNQQDYYQSSRVEAVLNDLPMQMMAPEKTEEPREFSLAQLAAGNGKPSRSLKLLAKTWNQIAFSEPHAIASVITISATIIRLSSKLSEKKEAKKYLLFALNESLKLSPEQLLEVVQALTHVKGINDPEILSLMSDLIVKLIENKESKIAVDLAIAQIPNFAGRSYNFFESAPNKQAFSQIRKNTLKILSALGVNGLESEIQRLTQAFTDVLSKAEQDLLHPLLIDYLQSCPTKDQGLEPLIQFIYKNRNGDLNDKLRSRWRWGPNDTIGKMAQEIQDHYLAYEKLSPHLAQMGRDLFKKVEEWLINNGIRYQEDEIRELAKMKHPMVAQMVRKLIQTLISSEDWQKLSLEEQRSWLKLRRKAFKRSFTNLAL